MGSHPSTSSKRSQWEPKPDDIGKYAVEFGAAVAEQVIGYEIPDPVLTGVKIAGQVAKNTAICMDAHHNWVRTQNRLKTARVEMASSCGGRSERMMTARREILSARIVHVNGGSDPFGNNWGYEGYRLWVKDGFCATFEVELGEAPPFGRT